MWGTDSAIPCAAEWRQPTALSGVKPGVGGARVFGRCAGGARGGCPRQNEQPRRLTRRAPKESGRWAALPFPMYKDAATHRFLRRSETRRPSLPSPPPQRPIRLFLPSSPSAPPPPHSQTKTVPERSGTTSRHGPAADRARHLTSADAAAGATEGGGPPRACSCARNASPVTISVAPYTTRRRPFPPRPACSITLWYST